MVIDHGDEPQQIIIQDDFMKSAGDLRAYFASRWEALSRHLSIFCGSAFPLTYY